MKKVIYISAGVSVAFGNVINAGCCGNESLKLTDIKIDGAENKNEEFKKNFKTISAGISASFKFDEGDISKNLVVFSLKESANVYYIIIANEELYGKQEDPVKKQCSKFADTPYYFIILDSGYKYSAVTGKVKYVADEKDKKLFKPAK